MSEQIRIVIQGRLPGLNELIASWGRPWYIGEGIKKRASQQVKLEIMAMRLKPFTKSIRVHFIWIERDKRRDRDNVTGGGSKVFMDAMKQIGLIKNDSRKWVEDITHDTTQIDKTNPRVEVLITEVE